MHWLPFPIMQVIWRMSEGTLCINPAVHLQPVHPLTDQCQKEREIECTSLAAIFLFWNHKPLLTLFIKFDRVLPNQDCASLFCLIPFCLISFRLKSKNIFEAICSSFDCPVESQGYGNFPVCMWNVHSLDDPTLTTMARGGTQKWGSSLGSAPQHLQSCKPLQVGIGSHWSDFNAGSTWGTASEEEEKV